MHVDGCKSGSEDVFIKEKDKKRKQHALAFLKVGTLDKIDLDRSNLPSET